ncbi:hypothetical protein BG011_006063 [Mortierella polycephala]|uniref:Zf-CHY-domain-containing protein n=1 Tax=Mortierella polycephala TaxID=41804 RepID=A0A9P6U9C3_9FUNG|nr:hypothetical protein BG011_006063 [Mortierella polycephala]
MSTSRVHSRASSVYLDAPEFLSDTPEDTTIQPIAESHQQDTPTRQEQANAAAAVNSSLEENVDDGSNNNQIDALDGDYVVLDDVVIAEETEDQEGRGRSQRSQTPGAVALADDGQQDLDPSEDDDDEEFMMEVDPATGLQRATSRSRSASQSRATALAARLRRQHRRMTSGSRPPRSRVSSGSTILSSGVTERSPRALAGSSSSSRQPAVPVVDEVAQKELRRKIVDIQMDPNISPTDKAAMIQKLMSSGWQGSQKAAADVHAEGATNTMEEDLATTYNNKERGYLGCKHYRRSCKLKANCCDKWFNCRFCHDDGCDHTIVRHETKTMLCMLCKTIQPAAQTCNSCHEQLAHYYCDICKLWDDDSTKSVYHCPDCGICRIGNGLDKDFFHCKKCNICMVIQFKGNHKCIERSLECDCPICGEYLFTSTTTVIFMTSYQCPTCWKALGDMSAYYEKIDSLLAEQTMPPEYANLFSIVLCNDCEVKSEAPYHFLYHKCDKCKGYNTKVLETFKRVSEGQVQVVENATAAGAAETAPENNISGGSNAVAGASSSSSTAASSSTTTTTVHLPAAPRSPLLDGNGSGDIAFGGNSDPSENSTS